MMRRSVRARAYGRCARWIRQQQRRVAARPRIRFGSVGGGLPLPCLLVGIGVPRLELGYLARQVAQLPGLSPETVLRRWRAGDIPRLSVGVELLAVPESDIDAWLETRRAA